MITRTARDHPLLVAFIVLALVVRLTFWFYTQRIWEDALISMTAARNVWEGFGLTHHASEPRVHCFTSPISVLIPVVAGPHAGLLLLRLSSLVASVAAIFFAYRIGVLLAFHWAGQVLILSYLACDQLQIFFGMSGMETQIVTAIALGTIYVFMQRAWWWLGISCGLATISRPEFILFLLPSVGVALLVFHYRATFKVALPALAIAIPWCGFATLYYGSPIPNTIVAKSNSFRSGFSSTSWDFKWRFMTESWRDYAPFKQFCFSIHAPLSDIVLQAIVLTVLLLFFIGLFASVRRRNALFICSAAVIGFLIYRNTVVLNHYYMWYVTPFFALAFLVAAYGLSQLAWWLPRSAITAGLILAFAYAFHLSFSMPLDKKVQKKIEIAVRAKTGELLNSMMTEKDTAVLEPLGFIGWEACNKTIYDYPGLGSKVAVRALKDMPQPSLTGLIDVLRPTYAVVRPHEFDEFQRRFPETASKYELAGRVRTPSKVNFKNRGYEYGMGDDDFRILRRLTTVGDTTRP